MVSPLNPPLALWPTRGFTLAVLASAPRRRRCPPTFYGGQLNFMLPPNKHPRRSLLPARAQKRESGAGDGKEAARQEGRSHSLVPLPPTPVIQGHVAPTGAHRGHQTEATRLGDGGSGKEGTFTE